MTVHLAAVTAAAYEALIATGETTENATQVVYDIAWFAYEKMGHAAWELTRALSMDDAERTRLATIVTQSLSDLCVNTWCALDFRIAENVWSATLERTGTIAAGASHCDFRWHTRLPKPPAQA